METPAIGIVVYQMTESVLLVALVGFLRMIPMLIFGPIMGILSDRYNRKLILFIGMFYLTSVFFALSILSFQSKLEIWHIFVGAFSTGLVWATDFPIRRAMVADVVGKKYFTPAFGIDLATSNFGRVIGPISAGIFISFIGVTAAYVSSLVTFLSTLIAIYLLKYVNIRIATKDSNTFFSNLVSGIKMVCRTEILLATILITIIMNMFAFPYNHMVPVIGKDVYLISPLLVGLLLSFEGLGATIGSIYIALNARTNYYNKIYFYGSIIFLSAILLFGISTNFWFILPFIFIGGFGLSGFATMQSIIIINSSPESNRGLVLGVIAAAIGTGPIGVLNIGFIAIYIGAQESVFLFAMIGLILVLLTGIFNKKIVR